MHELEFLKDLLVAFAIGGLVVYALRPLKVPSLVGLLVAGAIIGPHGFSLIKSPEEVEVLAEIGVVLLLFTIGLEFSLSQLMGMWRIIVGIGGGQIALSIGTTALLASVFQLEPGKALFFGFLVALSSTAIVLKLLGQRGELSTPYGRVSLGVLLMQDLAIVPLMLLTPFLAGKASGLGELFITLGKGLAIVIGVVVAARLVVPAILFRVVKTRSRELFLTLLVVLCLGTAWLTSLAGLSLALGAFLAGLAISESEYSHQALAEAVPFRDTFGSLFFLSIGMLMDVSFTVQNPLVVGAAVGSVIVLKALAAGIPAVALGFPTRVAVRSGFALAQIGEFAFVLAQAGLGFGLLDRQEYQVFLSASVISMLLTPLLLGAGGRIAERLGDTRLVPWRAQEDALRSSGEELTDHVVVVGYGVNGRNLTRALHATQVPYTILELNPETVRRARAEGEPIHYGDSTRAEILQGAAIGRARVLVLAISDAASVRAAVGIARRENPDLYIIVRTRFVSEMEELEKLGANEVIPEEFETSVEIFSRVLARYDVPRNVTLDLVGQIRQDMYEMLRAPSAVDRPTVEPDKLQGVCTETLLVRDGARAAGHALSESAVRSRTGATVIAVKRGAQVFGNPGPEFVLEEGDVTVLIGSREQLDAALTLFDEV